MAASFLLLVAFSTDASAQHFLQRGDAPPGVIGKQELMRRGMNPGYFQPVEVRGPEGTLVALSAEGSFTEAKTNIATAGMLLGEVYRLRVGNIPGREDFEVYPSIEVVNRLYPPPGQAMRFPIPVELTQEELEMAADGKYVTRIIYLEDNRNAFPVRDDPKHQRIVDTHAGEDPLRVADQLGRPVAILRMGSRIPDVDQDTGRFLFDCPPLMIYEKPAGDAPRNAGLEKPAEGPIVAGRQRRTFPRLPEGVQTYQR